MAEALLQAGATVALASKVGTKLDQAVEKLKREGYPAVGIPLDVRSEQSVNNAIKWVKREWEARCSRQ